MAYQLPNSNAGSVLPNSKSSNPTQAEKDAVNTPSGTSVNSKDEYGQPAPSGSVEFHDGKVTHTDYATGQTTTITNAQNNANNDEIMRRKNTTLDPSLPQNAQFNQSLGLPQQQQQVGAGLDNPNDPQAQTGMIDAAVADTGGQAQAQALDQGITGAGIAAIGGAGLIAAPETLGGSLLVAGGLIVGGLIAGAFKGYMSGKSEARKVLDVQLTKQAAAGISGGIKDMKLTIDKANSGLMSPTDAQAAFIAADMKIRQQGANLAYQAKIEPSSYNKNFKQIEDYNNYKSSLRAIYMAEMQKALLKANPNAPALSSPNDIEVSPVDDGTGTQ